MTENLGRFGWTAQAVMVEDFGLERVNEMFLEAFRAHHPDAELVTVESNEDLVFPTWHFLATFR